MPEIDENIKLQRITKLLEIGGTMLAASHECGAPMFRYQGKTLCPVCDVQVQEVGAGNKQSVEPGIQLQTEKIDRTVPYQKADYSQITAMTKNKIQNIASGLESETDLQRVRDKLECIELGIRILKLIG